MYEEHDYSDTIYWVEGIEGEGCGEIIKMTRENCFKFNWLDIGDLDEGKMLELVEILKSLNQSLEVKNE